MPSHQPIVCRAVINATDDYIDGNCTADAILQIDNHLKSCSECSAYVDHYRQVMQLTRSAMQLDGDDRQVPDGMIERTLEKLKKT